MPELLDLEPESIVRNGNVRGDLGDLSNLTASIAEHGILNPLIVRPTDEGGYLLICGQRRLAAAESLNFDRVPCLVRPDLAGLSLTVATQLVENEQRKDMTVAERVAAYHQLKMEGLSQAALAKTTATKPAEVKRLLAVAGSTTATAAVADHPAMTLEMAATLAEFDSDEDDRAQLLNTLNTRPGQWEHTVSRLRSERKTAKAIAKRVKELTAAGVTAFSAVDLPDGAKQVWNLQEAKGKRIEDHSACPGHAVVVGSGWQDDLEETEYCLDWQANGHHLPSWANPGRTPKSEQTPEQQEQVSAERKRVLANNKAWRAAEPVRRRFVADLLAKKALPAGALRFAITEAVAEPELMAQSRTNSDPILGGLLGIEAKTDVYGRACAAKALAEYSDARLTVVLLAHVAAAHEAVMDVHTWRNADGRAARWLTFLNSVGYNLADVEALVIEEAARKPRWQAGKWTNPDGEVDEVDDEPAADELDDEMGPGVEAGYDEDDYEEEADL